MTDLNLDSIKTVENTGAGHLYVLRSPAEELGALGTKMPWHFLF
jgi:hypothetical protein